MRGFIMYQDIKRNKIKTGFIISIYIVVITLIIYYICYALDFGIFSIIWHCLIKTNNKPCIE